MPHQPSLGVGGDRPYRPRGSATAAGPLLLILAAIINIINVKNSAVLFSVAYPNRFSMKRLESFKTPKA